MPCNSDYLEANSAERESKRCAECIVYVMEFINKPCPEWITNASKSYYGDPCSLNEMVVLLCSLCSAMPEGVKTAVMYNAKSKQSRQLADWWEEHEEADKQRRERENFGKQAQS